MYCIFTSITNVTWTITGGPMSVQRTAKILILVSFKFFYISPEKNIPTFPNDVSFVIKWFLGFEKAKAEDNSRTLYEQNVSYYSASNRKQTALKKCLFCCCQRWQGTSPPERLSAKSLLAMSMPRNLSIKNKNLRRVQLYTLHFYRIEWNGPIFFLTMPCIFLLAFRHSSSFFLVLLEVK